MCVCVCVWVCECEWVGVCVCVVRSSHSPVAVSQTVTVLSKEPMSIRSPVVLKFTQITSAEWPCTFRDKVLSISAHSLALVSFPGPQPSSVAQMKSWTGVLEQGYSRLALTTAFRDIL